MTNIDSLIHALKNTKEECKSSHNGKHRPIEKIGSITGYICKCCSKEIERTCETCNTAKSECIDWNDYYGSCEECL